MKYINYMDFSFFQIKLFLSLAETLSYTKTAQECLTTQSNVSKNIKSLETILGIQLFVRNTSRVSLTPAGRSLAESLSGYYQHIAKAVSRAAKIQEGLNERIIIAVPAYLNIAELIQPFLRVFLEKNPNVDVKIVQSENGKEFKNLLHGQYDLIFGYYDVLQIYPASKEIEKITICRSPNIAYMLDSNPLAEKETLTLEDIRNQNFIVHETGTFVGDSSQQFYNEMCALAGWKPNFSRFVRENGEAFDNILHDNDVYLACRFNAGRFHPHIVGRPIEGEEYKLQMVWDRSKYSCLETFINEFCSFLQIENG